MSTRVKTGVVFSSMLLTIMLVVGAVMGRGEEQDSAYKPLAVYTEVLAHIKSDYVEEPDIDKVTHGALQGLVEYLDPISSYLSADQYAEYLKAQNNPDGGSGYSTGLIVQKRGTYTAVVAVLPGSAAERAGISSGDLIEAVDDVSTRVLPPALLRARLSGEPGTTTRLLVRTSKNYDDPEEITLKREKVKLPDVESRILDSGAGYIKMKIVDDERIKQTRAAVRDLQKQGAKKIILDLRENSAGDHALGFTLADLFLADGELGYLEGQRYPKKEVDATSQDALTGFPLAIIVDSRTGGAAEIAAQVLSDRERAELVGERTYGVGAHLDTIKLDDGAALILSVAKYYGPKGVTVHENGLTPKNAVPADELRQWRDPEHDSSVVDPFLKKANEVLAAG